MSWYEWIFLIGIILIFFLIYHEMSILMKRMNDLSDKVYGCWDELGVVKEEHDHLKTALIEKKIIPDDDDDDDNDDDEEDINHGP